MGLVLLLLAALLLAGCAKKPAAEQPQAGPAATAEPEIEAENNGGYYVRVGENVYFRRYGTDALPENATFGVFTDTGNAGGESKLMAYNTVTGELTALYTENGAGPLWYSNGGFYLRQSAGGEDFAAWFAADGSGAETVGPGTLIGVTDSGLAAMYQSNWDVGHETVYTFYRDRQPVGEAATSESMQVAGLTDDGLFLVSMPDEDGAYGFWQITPEGEMIRLGELAEDEGAYAYAEPNRFLAADGKAIIGLSYYGGTGHYFDHGVFAEAEIGQADSFRVIEPDIDTSELYELPYPVASEAGGVDYVDALPNALRIGGDDTETLELWENGAWQPLAEHFAPQRADGWAVSRIVQHMDYVDGAAYATVAVACASPAYDIGWREGYALVSMRYLKVERDGTVTELACVERETELRGRVWFIEGAGVALWQQLNSEGGENPFWTDYAYAFPIADDADWDDGAFDGVTGLLPYDYGEGEAERYGYPIPDVDAAGELCLTLDRNGTVTRIRVAD